MDGAGDVGDGRELLALVGGGRVGVRRFRGDAVLRLGTGGMVKWALAAVPLAARAALALANDGLLDSWAELGPRGACSAALEPL